VEQGGNVRTITFAAGQVGEGNNMIARQLEGRTDRFEGCHLLLDFSNIEYLGSVELGTLINLRKRLNAAGGRLTLINLNPQVYETFEVTRLHTLFEICRQV
jgi:anti-anti-sigma factor